MDVPNLYFTQSHSKPPSQNVLNVKTLKGRCSVPMVWV